MSRHEKSHPKVAFSCANRSLRNAWPKRITSCQQRQEQQRQQVQQREQRQEQQRQQVQRREQQQVRQQVREQQQVRVQEQEPAPLFCHKQPGQQQRSQLPKRAISSFGFT
ncbi:MAG: hypothetical protein KJ852_08075 [Gammaproteobacteria bacterium]|nr:hypothetical protein [Gammaproteobacteria bacterium]MBU0786153.1 hypothetical protein [Gammaproteobacteria bacterium]MBU0816733.1 hypothetical protein [Gammaproteobacteria bacterium]MBU1786897.1 hypothetical protein [Gammaproteobacteria bacterium]